MIAPEASLSALFPAASYIDALHRCAAVSEVIARAIDFSHAGRDSVKQVRKGGDTPYWRHTDEVAGILAYYGRPEPEIVAGCCHDLDEDVKSPPYNLKGIETRFGPLVAQLDRDLTHIYTHEDYPALCRAERKALERARLATISPRAKTIKLADITVNLRDIRTLDPKFAAIYASENRALLPVLLVPGDPVNERLAVFVGELLAAFGE
jgi:(p)ppGpp synthase/HD superfamily hydrolase